MKCLLKVLFSPSKNEAVDNKGSNESLRCFKEHGINVTIILYLVTLCLWLAEIH